MIGAAFVLLIILIGLSLPIAAALGLMGFVLSEKFAFFPMTGALGVLRTTSCN